MSSSSQSTAADAGSASANGLPHVSALFLVKFDQKIGYTVAWKRSSVDVPLDGAVEYKSLPSGLHGVKNDLVYFVHEGYAGLSAFCNGPASEAERNARFVSVGVLVPLSAGRLGRSWLHAPRLQSMASALASDPDLTAPLEAFWEEQSSPQRPSPATLKTNNSTKGHSRARALSTLTAVLPSDQSLPPFHPARSIVEYINTFGPLVFRLQQLALLRKRILFVGAPPVRATCEYVYNISILSSIPTNVREFLSPGTDGLLRLPTLFSLGTHDIPLLEKLHKSENGTHPTSENEFASQGFAACTTDEIITTKKDLYDVIVELPPPYDEAPERRQWPTIRTSDGTQIKASQRDLRRYKLLHHELWTYQHGSAAANGDADADEEARLLGGSEPDEAEDDFNETFDDRSVEPMTLSRLAYLGFMWWASAGERDAYTTEERERDRRILGDLTDYHDGIHTAIIAAFHRWTSELFMSLAGIVEAADEDEDREDGDPLDVDRDDLARLGLDTWSETDKVFIQELLWMYFGRRACIHGASLECCGVKIPVF